MKRIALLSYFQILSTIGKHIILSCYYSETDTLRGTDVTPSVGRKSAGHAGDFVSSARRKWGKYSYNPQLTISSVHLANP